MGEALHAYNPEAKLLPIVRAPIDRLLSQYQYHKQIGLLQGDLFCRGTRRSQLP